MIRSPIVRKLSRVTLAIASLLLISGGVLIYNGKARLGDGFMIAGGIMLVAGAGVLAATRTGDKDAR